MGCGAHSSPQVTKYPKRKKSQNKLLKQIQLNNLVLKSLQNG